MNTKNFSKSFYDDFNPSVSFYEDPKDAWDRWENEKFKSPAIRNAINWNETGSFIPVDSILNRLRFEMLSTGMKLEVSFQLIAF